MINVTVYKSAEDINAKKNGIKVQGKTVSDIYTQINKEIVPTIDDFYGWVGEVSNGSSIYATVGVWD